ncbi:apolipoprotein N-acyltransferase [Frigidibacter sp. ROC022]|uniref:apolipoprotein N-acyltransferase n=1 Tax=Frigidibacter sp. ROC022 TaxID=2971796 RepID=UPI00215A9D3F|nr:apolipoprotein N-acyltransferase [Frigidibacter sp. ROC022]MCR8722819.1 apolipoprotein N-acyltransferase [Frigidibacter sp. ROC022]
MTAESAVGPRPAGPRRRVALALGAGLLAALGHPPFSALWAALPGLALAVWLFDRAATPRRAGWTLWWVGLGYFGLALSWIVQPFFVDPARHGWMAPFAIVFMAGGLALFWGLAAVLAWWLGGDSRPRRRWALVLALTGSELLRGYIFTGFPWATIGHVWIGWPGMQAAAWVGAGGLSLLALSVAALAASARLPGLVAALALAGGVTGLGFWRQAQPLPPDAGPVVRLVQPDIPQSLKWDAETAANTFDTLLALTAAPADSSAPPPDVVIWPETALPYLLDGAGPLLEQARGASGDARLLIGAIRVEGSRGFNSLVEIEPGGVPGAIYDKHHLVPFGEYVPLDFVLGWVGLSAMTAQEGFGYTPGPGARVLDLGKLGRMLPLICYEAIFPQDILSAPERPDWLLQITNDAWFGTFSGPYQHLAQARLRAVEFGLPLIRVANTGVSAVIDAHGGIRASLPLGRRGHLDAPLPAPLPPTPYARTGDWPLAVLVLLALAGLGLTRRRLSD